VIVFVANFLRGHPLDGLPLVTQKLQVRHILFLDHKTQQEQANRERVETVILICRESLVPGFEEDGKLAVAAVDDAVGSEQERVKDLQYLALGYLYFDLHSRLVMYQFKFKHSTKVGCIVLELVEAKLPILALRLLVTPLNDILDFFDVVSIDFGLPEVLVDDGEVKVRRLAAHHHEAINRAAVHQNLKFLAILADHVSN